MTTLRIAWLFARRSAFDRATVLLPVIAFAVSSLLLLVVAGGAQAFFSWNDGDAFVYQALAVIALALLVVPLIGLGGSAARLSARRRDDRLSGLRLLGASPAMVAALTVIESSALAVAGAVVGVALYLPVAPLVGLIPFRGDPLGAGAVLHPGAVALAVVGVAVLSAVSAGLGLRSVVVSPLGVRTRQSAPRMHWVRAAVAAVVIVATYLVMSTLQLFEGALMVLTVFGIGFGGTIAVLNLVGPWALRMVASGQARRATTARRLLAARAVLESPKAAWRQVSGVAMTSFMAVFAGVGVGILGIAGDGGDGQARTLLADIRTGVVVTVIVSFLMVACSAGVNQAAAVLDRRDLYVSLDRIGMPVREMDAARRRAVMSPLRVTTIGSALTAAIVVLPLAGLSLLVAPLTLLMVAGCLAAGVLLVWAALRATRPVLTHVLAETAPSL
ncbi:permease [uncultured Leifsonia sp.]|uniref:permease n=1 Tax=uncultured Leifsonia sp. TaxID=340359 RepID=UPI0025FF940F|nr:permease [uncultured Leifsonia sp.]